MSLTGNLAGSIAHPLAVQQKGMRHRDIRTTMTVYCDVADDRICVVLAKGVIFERFGLTFAP